MPHHNVYVNGKVHVRARQCKTCIFGPKSPVSDERRVEMIEGCGDDGVIPCHSHIHQGAAIEPVCRGFADLNVTVGLRLAEALGVIELVS